MIFKHAKQGGGAKAPSLITHEPPLFIDRGAAYKYSPALAKALTFKNMFADPGAEDSDKFYQAYRREEGLIYVPPAAVPPCDDDRRSRGIPVQFGGTFKAKDAEQQRVVDESTSLLMAGRNHIIEAPTGFGKCLSPDTPVLMYDGTVQRSDALRVGDLVMGPDSQPRTVLKINPGRGVMYRITPNKGPAWSCNGDHILVLKCTADCDYGHKGQEVEVPLSEYLNWPKAKRHVYKQWRVAVDFEEQAVPNDPYLVGLYLADGSKDIPLFNLCETDTALHQAVRDRLVVQSEWSDRGTQYLRLRASSRFWWELGPCLGKLDRSIPSAYIANSREVRLQLLAGLLDGDGHLVKGTVFELSSKYPSLAEGIALVARSLGLAVTVKQVTKGITTSGFSGLYYRVHISGDTDMIPTRLARKQARPRRQAKNPLVTGFKVECVGDGPYFGICLDGDRRYLMGDCTVTHNTYVGSAIALNCNRSTLIVVNKEMIIGQWVEALEIVLGLHRTDIGLIQGDKCNVQGRPVVIAMLQSLCKPGRYPSWVYEAFGLTIFDEVHRLGSDYFPQVMWNLSCRSMIGLSARPERKDRRERLFKMFIGPTLVKSEAMPLPFKVLAVDTPYKLPRRLVVDKLTKEKKLTKVEPPHGRTVMLEKGMIKCHGRTQIAVKLTCISAERGRRIILFFTTLDYMKAVGAEIAKVLGAGEVGYLTGGMKEAARQEAAEKTVLCTTYQMTSEAVNLPWFDTAVLVSPKSDVLQVVGRILRPYEGKKDPTVIDLVDRDSTVLTGFHNQRMKFYKSKQAPVKKITI